MPEWKFRSTKWGKFTQVPGIFSSSKEMGKTVSTDKKTVSLCSPNIIINK